jgi:hypothetical protein
MIMVADRPPPGDHPMTLEALQHGIGMLMTFPAGREKFLSELLVLPNAVRSPADEPETPR